MIIVPMHTEGSTIPYYKTGRVMTDVAERAVLVNGDGYTGSSVPEICKIAFANALIRQQLTALGNSKRMHTDD